MSTARFFAEKRPIAWVALVATLGWGVYAYRQMPQRQDPVVPVRQAVVVTYYPGASAEKVEAQVTQRVERKLAESPAVERVYSTSSAGLSTVFVDLFEATKNVEPVWLDLKNKLAEIPDLPQVGDRPLTPFLNAEFGDTVAMMLTVSSPPVSGLEIELRARSIREVLAAARAACAPALAENRVSGVLVYPTTVARDHVLRLGHGLLQRLTESGVARDGRILEAPGTGLVDFQLAADEDDLDREVKAWLAESDTFGWHPDVWPPFLVKDLDELPLYLGFVARDKYTYGELRGFAERIRDRLRSCPTVGKVELIGAQEEEVSLFYSGPRLDQIGLRPEAVVEALQGRNTNLPGGRIDLPGQNIMVEPSGAFRSERELGEVVVAVTEGGFPLYLRDLVEVHRGYQDPPGTMNFRVLKAPGKPTRAGTAAVDSVALTEPKVVPDEYALQTGRAITLAVRQIQGVQIARFGQDVQGVLAALQGELPDDLRVERVSDEPSQVEHKISEFNTCLIEAVVIVILFALVFMEWRSTALVAISIPLTLAMTLGFCQLLGIDLQQVSIAALIIALGLLVDDPVVASDAINREMASGVPRERAAWQGPDKLARAILYATLTNIVAFLPLLLIAGSTGDFIYSLPVVVTASLVASRIVSMTFMPLLGYYILRGQKGLEAGLEGSGGGSRFAKVYNSFTVWCLDHKAISMAVCLAILAGCCSVFPFIGTAFFPKDLHSVFTVNVFLPEGTPLKVTAEEAERVVERIDALEGRQVTSYTLFVGAGGPRFWLSVNPEPDAEGYAQILVHTVDKKSTSAIVARLKASLPQECAGARVTIEELETGPPIGVPVQVRIYGPEIEPLRRLAGQLKAEMKEVPGTTNIHDDWDPEVLQMSLRIDTDRANLTGITNDDVAAIVSTGLSGYTATYLREEDRQIPVRLRLRGDERSQLSDLYNLSAVSSMTNLRVPLRQIARFEPELVSPKVLRRDYQRCITVKCDAVPGTLPSAVVEQLAERLPRMIWPPGYRYEFAGEHEEQQKGFASVLVALIVSILGIYLALVLQFNSVTKPLVVFGAVPFGLAGGLMGLPLFGAPFGFMAFLGVASLGGVIVSHIIVLFDYIEDMHERGEELHRAVIDACLVRLRPVLVTVLATVGGLIPLALKGGPLWEPMCYVQIFGLLVATLVTKVVVPVMFVAFVEKLGLIEWSHAPAERRAPEA